MTFPLIKRMKKKKSNKEELEEISLDGTFNGLIETPLNKKVSYSLFNLIDYVTSISPPFHFLHELISYWRIIQYLGSALCANFVDVWNEFMFNVVGYISIAFHFIPTFSRDEYRVIGLYVYDVVWILCFGLLFASAFYFQTNAKLSNAVAITISIIFSTIGYISHPYALNLLGETISKCIVDPSYVDISTIIAIVLTIILLVGYLLFYKSIYVVTIVFKPDSLPAIMPSNSILILLVNYVTTFILGFASQLENQILWQRILKCVIMGISIIIFGASILILFTSGGLIRLSQIKFIAAAAISGSIFILIGIICVNITISANELILFVCASVYAICYFSFSWFINHHDTKSLLTLDVLVEATNFYDRYVSSPPKASDLAVIGMRYAHPYLLDFQLFREAVDRWPRDATIWLIFAKFCAIYPEETQTLYWIQNSMINNNVSGTMAKNIISQITTVGLEREVNLHPTIKGKLDHLHKQVLSNKQKIRLIWDQAIQGNLHEMEALISNSFHSTEQSSAEFLHLLLRYPRNRFVARSYSRFLKNVIGDEKGSNDWSKNYDILQKGGEVVPDRAHTLGMNSFPLLPDKLKASSAGIQLGEMMSTDEVDNPFEEVGDDEEIVIKSNIKQMIEDLKFPIVKYSRLYMFCLSIVLCVIPVIAFVAIKSIYQEYITEPIDFAYLLSNTRTRLFQLIAVGLHYVFELNGMVSDNFTEYENESNLEYMSENANYTSYAMLEFIISDISSNQEEFSQFNSITRTEYTIKIMDLVFDSGVNFKIRDSPNGQVSILGVGLMQAINEYVIRFQRLISLDPVTDASTISNIQDTEYCLVPLDNIETMADVISNCLTYLDDHVVYIYKTIKNITNTVIIILSLCYFIGYFVLIFFLTRELNHEQLSVFQCLASLPKDVAVEVSNSFKQMKKDSEDEEKNDRDSSSADEFNKQEENLLKYFTQFSSNKVSNGLSIMLIIVSFIVIVLDFLTAFMIISSLTTAATDVNEYSPHLDYIQKSYSYDIACVIYAFLISASSTADFTVDGFDIDTILDIYNSWTDESQDVYNVYHYGSKSAGVVAYKDLISLLQEIEENNVFEDCINTSELTVPTSVHEIYNCWSSELLWSIEMFWMSSVVQRFSADREQYTFDLDHTYLSTTWHTNIVHLYDQYFAPIFVYLRPSITKLVASAMNEYILALVIFALVSIILFLYIIHKSTELTLKLKYSLKLAMHAPAHVLIQQNFFISVCNGNFHNKIGGSTARNDDFYTQVVKELPDGVVITNAGKIVRLNKAVSRMFKKDDKDLVGKSVVELLKEIDSECIPLLGTEITFQRTVSYKDDDGSDCSAELTYHKLQQQQSIFVFRDITQQVMYNKLIAEEQGKSDALLASILPASLVPRVRAGEKNISFSVQSASILFLDIVSFTPWCSSNTAGFIMSTLNRMYRDFDAILATHPTMTKIKCIGDCYMAAAGLFAEVNQPTVHAKDICEFGLEVIQCIKKINSELGTSLQIRVGINSGGPLVAGVLGAERKPTFEIIGPAINMAQQMEHHGVPMKVHVSRATYELIYGGNFRIKERGTVEVKQGVVQTYIVEETIGNA